MTHPELGHLHPGQFKPLAGVRKRPPSCFRPCSFSPFPAQQPRQYVQLSQITSPSAQIPQTAPHPLEHEPKALRVSWEDLQDLPAALSCPPLLNLGFDCFLRSLLGQVHLAVADHTTFSPTSTCTPFLQPKRPCSPPGWQCISLGVPRHPEEPEEHS